MTITASSATPLVMALEAESALSLQVVTTRINRQPNGVSKTGNSEYTLTQHDIAALPQGENTPINEVLLQMPGVVRGRRSTEFMSKVNTKIFSGASTGS